MPMDKVLLIETNIDDMTGENFGYLLNLLMDNGAIDVSYTSAYGKKNRPLYILSVIVPIGKEKDFAKIIFKNSTTSGIRIQEIDRIIMDRQILKINIDGYNIDVKRLYFEDIEKFSPEWDNCVEVSKKLNITPNDVYNKVMSKIIKEGEK